MAAKDITGMRKDLKLNTMAELTNYELWQIEHYGNIVPEASVTPDGELFESGIEELERMAEWMNEMAEMQNQ